MKQLLKWQYIGIWFCVAVSNGLYSAQVDSELSESLITMFLEPTLASFNKGNFYEPLINTLKAQNVALKTFITYFYQTKAVAAIKTVCPSQQHCIALAKNLCTDTVQDVCFTTEYSFKDNKDGRQCLLLHTIKDEPITLSNNNSSQEKSDVLPKHIYLKGDLKMEKIIETVYNAQPVVYALALNKQSVPSKQTKYDEVYTLIYHSLLSCRSNPGKVLGNDLYMKIYKFHTQYELCRILHSDYAHMEELEASLTTLSIPKKTQLGVMSTLNDMSRSYMDVMMPLKYLNKDEKVDFALSHIREAIEYLLITDTDNTKYVTISFKERLELLARWAHVIYFYHYSDIKNEIMVNKYLKPIRDHLGKIN